MVLLKGKKKSEELSVGNFPTHTPKGAMDGLRFGSYPPRQDPLDKGLTESNCTRQAARRGSA